MIEYITKEVIDETRKTTPVVFGPIGENVYRRTYSRTKRDGSQEDWHETAARVVNGNLNYVPQHFIEKEEAQKLYKLIVEMQILPAGRHLWATGIGSNKDYIVNCFASDFTPNFSEHFQFTFMRLMEGGGVGSNYSTLFINSREKTKAWQPKSKINLHLVCHPSHNDYNETIDINSGEEKFLDPNYDPNVDYGFFPKINFKDILSDKYSCDWDPRISNGDGAKYIRVDDSREGWASALVALLDAHISDENQDRDIVIDVSNVRHKGAILKGFGGKASGPDALMLLLKRINLLLNSRVNQNLCSMEFMLIDHYIAQAVVSGGVRRSARMAMKYWKDPDIFDFINCKKMVPGEIPQHWTTNISVVIDKKFFNALKRGDSHAEAVYDALAEGASSNGEPGIINASKALEGEAPGTEFFVTNPCGEIGFVRYEDLLCFDVCNLGHGNLDRMDNPEEAFRLLTRFLIRATFAPVMDEKQRKNVDRNRRIGVGILGYHSWLVKNKIKYSDAPNKESVRLFFQRMKRIIDEEAKKYCSALRIPECIKKTTIAPTGTIGNLAGCTTGCQSVFSKFYIRRVRISDTDPLLKELEGKGYKIEKDRYAANTSVVEYYCVDPIYDQVVEVLKKEYLAQGMPEAKANGLAQEAAVEIIEDQSELTLEDVLATQRMLQKEFVDNAISITINVDSTKLSKEELKATLKHYLPDLKGVTIFPEVSMPQTPLERLSWEELMQKEIEGYKIERTQAEMVCIGGCPIK
jgi:ribonucleoside-triphosphate reductase